MAFLTLVQNIALLISLVVVFERITRRWTRNTPGRQALIGALFGGAGVTGMLAPLHLMPGIIFDGRSIVLSIAGLFGGPVTAVSAAAICAAYRLSLGGAGAWVGAAVIAVSAGLGVAWYYLRRRWPCAARSYGLMILAISVHLAMLALMLGLPGGISLEVLQQIALPVLTLFPAATWLLGMLFLDTEARQAAEAALRVSEARYRAFVETANEGVWAMDAGHATTFVNQRMADMLGYSVDEIIGRSVESFMLPEDMNSHQARMRGRHAGKSQQYEHRFRRKDGSVVCTAVSASPLLDAAGGFRGSVGFFTDITERRRTETALAASARALEDALRIARMATWRYDAATDAFTFDDRFYTMCGTTAELEGGYTMQSNAFARRHVVPRFAEEIGAIIEQAIQAPGAVPEMHADGQLIRADGSLMWVAIWFRAEKDASGRTSGLFGVVQDVDERKRAEDALHESEQRFRLLNESLEQRVQERTAQLESANRELEAFSYSVSHDLRAPLRAIDGFSRMLIEDHAGGLPPEALRLARRVRDGARQMGQLIDDLLRFARLSRQPVARAQVDLASLARQLWDEDLLPDRNGRRACLTLCELPACSGDPALLRLVMINLLSNALKFTRGRPQARVEIGFADPPGAYYIKDNGTGFDMRYSGKLFGVFQRLHRAEEYEGTGVGLALVQRIVARHGGRVWAEAEPDKGATFYFTVPG